MTLHKETHRFPRFRFFFCLLIGVWTVCIVGSFLWNLRQQADRSLQMARRTAQITFENDVLYRRWSASHGGVYVRVSEDCPPNPYLTVPDRDLTTTSGMSLTLVNPAYMARQVNALTNTTGGSQGHLASLRPIRPENAPDPWEADALRSFEEGAAEASSLEETAEGETLRLMRPFLVEQGCLKCHAAQGYKLGDIRGGVSVSVPMASLRAIEKPMTARLALAHLGLWMVGLAGIGVFWRGLRRQMLGRKRAEEEREITVDLLQLVNRGLDTRRLIEASARFFREQSGCEAVGIRLREGDDYPYFETHGFPEEFLRLENALCVRDPDGTIQRDRAGDPVLACMCGNVIRGRFDPSKPFFTPGGSFWANDTTRLLATTSDADRRTATRNRCNRQGYESVALIVLRCGEERMGLLQLNDRRKGMFTAESIALWERLAGYLGVALAKTRAEELLRESEERLRLLGDNLPDSAVYQYAHEADGRVRFLYFSAGIERLNGVRAEDVLRDPGSLYRQLPPEYIERLAEAEARSKRDLSDFDMDLPMRRSDGELRWMRLHSRPRRLPDGRTVWDGVQTDITERKRIEETLRRRAEEVERLLETVPAAVWVAHDPQCLTITGNRRANAFYEARSGENVSASTLPEVRRFFTPDGREVPAEELPMQKAAATNQDVRDCELHVQLPSGRRIAMLGSAVPLRDPAGSVRGCIGTFLDITQRRAAEEALRASEEKYRNLFNNMAEEVHFWQLARDDAGQIKTWRLVDANPPTLKTWGRRSVEEIRGKTTDEIFGPGATEHYLPVVRKIFTEGAPHVFEDYFQHLDKHFRFTSVPLGEYFITTGADITAVKKAQESLNASLAEKEVLLKEIHHRVKNNMQVISSLMALQMEQLPDTATRAVLQDVTHRVRSMALVHEKLYQSADMARVELAEYAQSLLDYLWRAHGTTASGVRLVTDLEPVPLSVNAAVPCGLVLNELVSNALKHAFPKGNSKFQASNDKQSRNPKGPMTETEPCEVRVTLKGDAEGRVCLRVRDNGTGLPPGLDWRQADSLGLRLVQILAGQLHATVEVSGEGGTEFSVTFRR